MEKEKEMEVQKSIIIEGNENLKEIIFKEKEVEKER